MTSNDIPNIIKKFSNLLCSTLNFDYLYFWIYFIFKRRNIFKPLVDKLSFFRENHWIKITLLISISVVKYIYRRNKLLFLTSLIAPVWDFGLMYLSYLDTFESMNLRDEKLKDILPFPYVIYSLNR